MASGQLSTDSTTAGPVQYGPGLRAALTAVDDCSVKRGDSPWAWVRHRSGSIVTAQWQYQSLIPIRAAMILWNEPPRRPLCQFCSPAGGTSHSQVR